MEASDWLKQVGTVPSCFKYIRIYIYIYILYIYIYIYIYGRESGKYYGRERGRDGKGWEEGTAGYTCSEKILQTFNLSEQFN